MSHASNFLLASLPASDLGALRPHFRAIELPRNYPTASALFRSSRNQITSNCQAIESTIGPTNKPIMPCASVPMRPAG